MELRRYVADDKMSTLRFFVCPDSQSNNPSIQNKPLTCACIKAFNLFNKRRNLNAVSTNILDRAAQPTGMSARFSVIQAFANTARETRTSSPLRPPELNLKPDQSQQSKDFDNQSGEIPAEQHIAAFSNTGRNAFFCGKLGCTSKLLKGIHCRKYRAATHFKTVMRL